ncbi:MAG TPA: tetratricopeptide repeat protein [Syntrophales bacterium]|nr:tetratricopeptide repeat protein [Syntrophales bacterium]
MEATNRTRLRRMSVFFLIFVLPLFASACANEMAANLHLKSGMAYIEARQYAAAIKELLAAEKENPGDPAIKYYLGMSYHLKNLPDEAVKYLTRAVELKPDYSEAYNYLGLVYDGIGRYDDAIRSFQNAVSNILYETPSYALNNMAWSYFKKGDYESALARFKEAMGQENNLFSRAMLEKNIGMVYFTKGDMSQASAHLSRSLNMAPEFTEAHYWLGKVYAATKKRGAAVREFQEVVKAAPESEFGIRAKEELEKLPGNRR